MTYCTQGEGIALVIGVGTGNWMKSISGPELHSTPLRDKLINEYKKFRNISIMMSLITFVILLIYFCVCKIEGEFNWKTKNKEYIHEWCIYCIICSMIILAFTPWVNLWYHNILSLLYLHGSIKNEFLVKNPETFDAIVSADTIIMDIDLNFIKTTFEITDIWQGEIIYFDYEKESFDVSNYFPNPKGLKLFLEGFGCYYVNDNPTPNLSECTIKDFLQKCQFDMNELKSRNNLDPFTQFMFNGARKKTGMIVTGVNDNECGYSKRLYVKGAPERVIDTCSHYLNISGIRIILTNQTREDLVNIMHSEFSQTGLRCIALAYKDLSPNEGGSDHCDMHPNRSDRVIEHSGLTFISFIGLRSSISSSVKKSLINISKSGKNMIITTGKHQLDAQNILQAGDLLPVIKKAYAMIDGISFINEIDAVDGTSFNDNRYCKNSQPKCKIQNKEVLKSITSELVAMHRAGGLHKDTLIRGLQDLGKRVIAFGDSISHSPLLKNADVGIGMGLSGTDNAKQASDALLLNDDLSAFETALDLSQKYMHTLNNVHGIKRWANIVSVICIYILTIAWCYFSSSIIS